MDTHFKLMYTGLNIMDELATVEIMIDRQLGRIHVHDTQYVCEPQYDYGKKAYTFSEETLQMARVLFAKQIIYTEIVNFNDWVQNVDWLFYCSKAVILRYLDGKFITYGRDSKEPVLYQKYS